MSMHGTKVTAKEIRIPIGECPWCGTERVTLRDYLCYHSVNLCCHEIFRALASKASLALRHFPNNKVDTGDSWKEYLNTFLEIVKADKRSYERFKPLLDKIEAFQVEYDGELFDFFEFLVKLYVARGYIEMRGGMRDELQKQCLVCSKELPEGFKHEICRSCMEHVGQPEADFEVEHSTVEAPKRTGMHFKRD